MKEKIQFGFKGKNQLPLFMLWRESKDENDEIVHAEVIFSTYSPLRAVRRVNVNNKVLDSMKKVMAKYKKMFRNLKEK